MIDFMFIGERRSPTAIARGWTWADGRLSAKTLHEALAPLGLTYGVQYECRNILDDHGVYYDYTIIEYVRLYQQGVQLVAMCRPAELVFQSHRIPHVRITHPSARGSIRARAVYQAHVASILQPIIKEIVRGRP